MPRGGRYLGKFVPIDRDIDVVGLNNGVVFETNGETFSCSFQ